MGFRTSSLTYPSSASGGLVIVVSDDEALFLIDRISRHQIPARIMIADHVLTPLCNVGRRLGHIDSSDPYPLALSTEPGVPRPYCFVTFFIASFMSFDLVAWDKDGA